MTTRLEATPDYTAIKQKQNAAWSSGDYAKIGTTLQIVGEQLAETMDLATDSEVLDVAAGNGNATLAFARRWCQVTSTDYVGTLLARGRDRANAEALGVHFQIADAEALPFTDNAFDAVVSTFGVMFTPNQEKAASELARVCRPGGKIGLASWTPESFIGALFQTLGRHLPPPAGIKSPALWGKQDWLEQHFASPARSIQVELRDFIFRYRSPDHFISFFKEFYGPVHKAFLALPPEQESALEDDLRAAIARFNTATDGSMRVPGQYAEAIITL